MPYVNTYSDYLRLKKIQSRLNTLRQSNSLNLQKYSKFSHYTPSDSIRRVPVNFLTKEGKQTIYEQYETLYDEIQEENTAVLREYQTERDYEFSVSALVSVNEPAPPPSLFERGYVSDTLIQIAQSLVPPVNTSKLLAGPSFRNIKLAEEAYIAVGSRATVVEGFTYQQQLSSDTYAIYTNSTEQKLIIAFRGTNVYRDIITDITLLAGYTSDYRFVEALALYNSLRTNQSYQTYTIEATGHSLGGTLGLYLNTVTGIHADVFQPAIGKDLFLNNTYRSTATAHIVKGDVVSPLIHKNNIVSTLYIYPVENSNYGYLGYHATSNFRSP